MQEFNVSEYWNFTSLCGVSDSWNHLFQTMDLIFGSIRMRRGRMSMPIRQFWNFPTILMYPGSTFLAWNFIFHKIEILPQHLVFLEFWGLWNHLILNFDYMALSHYLGWKRRAEEHTDKIPIWLIDTMDQTCVVLRVFHLKWLRAYSYLPSCVAGW